MLYRGMDRAQLDVAYNNLAAVTASAKLLADWSVRTVRAFVSGIAGISASPMAKPTQCHPVCRRGAALVAVAPAARARSRGAARVQEAHTRRKTDRRSVRPRIRQRRSIASGWPFVYLGNRDFLNASTHANRACSLV